MAGGIGTRFWPYGTSKLPKQFLDIENNRETMIQKTVKRLENLISPKKTYIVTNVAYKSIIKKQLPQIPEDNIILEPFGRNTAPCIALTCLYIRQFDPQANVFVVPSDHIIHNVTEFQRVVKGALKFVNKNGGIVTLGIHPTKPETGFGYIQYDSDKMEEVEIEEDKKKIFEQIYKVKTFAEKPNLEVARMFLESGDFLWNSGMFIFRVDTMMEEIEKYLPDLSFALKPLETKLYSNDFQKELENTYAKIKGISIDYGVMEKSKQVFIIRSFFDWSDVGSWDEIYRLRKKDKHGNVTQGKTVMINSNNCMVMNHQRISAVVGCDDLIIIDTDAGLLVCKRGESQNVREVVDYLRRKGLDEYL
jgi:mannose-1-phosphate guanylyltransferase